MPELKAQVAVQYKPESEYITEGLIEGAKKGIKIGAGIAVLAGVTVSIINPSSVIPGAMSGLLTGVLVGVVSETAERMFVLYRHDKMVVGEWYQDHDSSTLYGKNVPGWANFCQKTLGW